MKLAHMFYAFGFALKSGCNMNVARNITRNMGHWSLDMTAFLFESNGCGQKIHWLNYRYETSVHNTNRRQRKARVGAMDGGGTEE
jgi:hypothetical protein